MSREALACGQYRIQPVYGRVDGALAAELVAFWCANNAIPDPAEAQRRAAEVVCIARNGAGALVGVNSVYPGPDGYWLFRMFIRHGDGVPGLAERMTLAAVACVREFALHSAPAIRGMALTTENPKLMHPALRRKLERLGWNYVGRGPQGRDAWKIDFRQPSC